MHPLAHRHQEATPALVPDSTCSFCNSKDCPFATYGKTDGCSEGGESWKLMNTFQNIHFGFDMYIYIIHIHIYVYLRMMVCECIEMHIEAEGNICLSSQLCYRCRFDISSTDLTTSMHSAIYVLYTCYCKGPHILFYSTHLYPYLNHISFIHFFECIQLYRHIINDTGLHIYIYVSYDICLNII